MEPIRSLEPEPGFVKGVREIATKTGAVLIVDEASAGFRLNTGTPIKGAYGKVEIACTY
jgi:glutamate-1-semialdehyde 2,1-aminomutase